MMLSAPRTLPHDRAGDSLAFQWTLRRRILLFTGVVLIFLLFLISQVLLYQWRDIIIAKQRDAVIGISKTFAVNVLDALIREEHSGSVREGMLQTSIDDFMRSMGSVKYVAIMDEKNLPLAVGPPLDADVIPDMDLATVRASAMHIRIMNDPHFAWVIEIQMPLRIAQKSWGSASIGFDAQPIRDELHTLFLLLFAATVTVSLATLIVLNFLASRLTRSLNALVREMDSVDLERGAPTPTARREDEVAFLFERFDRMKKRIDQSRHELENAQRQIYQAEKLASIGRLASGIAHQVNNPLNGIRSCLYAIEKEPDNLPQTREYLELIDEAITSIESVVQKLLGFARQQSPSESVIDISASTRKVLDLFDVRLREKKIRVVQELPEDLPTVAIDHQLFQEVVMNLLLNSYDAAETDGEIRVRAGRAGERHVFLSVRDDGAGIPAENLDRIFEPFFTTKETGKGTGLGLSVSQSIIESHGGRITVDSAPGRGTEFTVRLPIGRQDEDPHH